MLFIAVDETLWYFHRQETFEYSNLLRAWLYLPRAAACGILLFFYRRHYSELVPADLRVGRHTLLSFATGVIVFILWINMDWTLGMQSMPTGFDPGTIQNEAARWLLIAVRCTGAIIIVPIMEELFWRSFLLRFLINHDFTQVAIGRITWFSLIATTILFGLEHHHVFAGMMAGLLFIFIYRVTGSIAQCILCHATANACLAVYVLSQAQWHFW